MKKIIIGILILFACLVIALPGIIFYYGFLYSPSDISKEQEAILLEIYGRCGDDIAAAYELMQDFVPDIGDERIAIPHCYPSHEEAQARWDSRAFELLLAAEAAANEILDNARDKSEFSFNSWVYIGTLYKSLDLPLWFNSGFHQITLIYCPDNMIPNCKPLNNLAGWYYDAIPFM